MAFEGYQITVPGGNALGANFSGATSSPGYFICNMSSSGEYVFPTTAGAIFTGIVQNGATSGSIQSVAMLGVSKVRHDGTLSPGQKWSATSSGVAKPTTGFASNAAYYGGIALAVPSTVVNSIITVSLIGLSMST